MAINQFRTHVRHFLMAASEADVTIELIRAREAGETERAEYTEEFLAELHAECNDCPVCETEAGGTDCSGCHIEEGLGVSVDFAGCPGAGDCDEEGDFAELEDFLGLDNYPGCGSDEDCVGCPESGDCADEAY
jgi:hypothetical protein